MDNKMEMNNKTAIIIISIVAVAAVGYFLIDFERSAPRNQDDDQIAEVSYKFKGTAVEVREDNLALAGSFVLQDDLDQEIKKSEEIVTVFFNDDLVVLKKTASVAKNSFGFDQNLELDSLEPEVVSVAQMKTDIETYNPVLTVNAAEDIYGKDVFYAASIEYIIISSQ